MNEIPKNSGAELISELKKERPNLQYLSEVGTILQDYISASVECAESENDPFANALQTNYHTCLFMVVAKRATKSLEFLH